MEETLLIQGKFTAPGKAVYIVLRSDVDKMIVSNYTNLAAVTATEGIKFEWNRGMSSGYAIEEYLGTGDTAGCVLRRVKTSAGFTLVDTSNVNLGALNGVNNDAPITAISNAAKPVVTNGSNNLLDAGSVVRISNSIGARQLSGMDIEVGHNTLTNTTFDLSYVPQIAVATDAGWRQVPNESIFYPRFRYITAVTRSVGTGKVRTEVKVSVKHNFKVGQKVRFNMGHYAESTTKCKQLDGLVGTILSVRNGEDAAVTFEGQALAINSFIVDINSSTFQAFIFPTEALQGESAFTHATVTPVGMDTATAITYGADPFSASRENESYIGIKLSYGTTAGAGKNSPAGTSGDEIYWEAHKASFVDNTGTLIK